MKRREFITLLGGAAAAWPVAARAQQPAMPVIGFLSHRVAWPIRASRCVPRGPEGNRLCRGPERGDRIPMGGGSISIGCRRWRPNWSPSGLRDRRDWRPRTACAAKAATSDDPDCLRSGGDPVRLGLVASLSRPGGNVTGYTFFTASWPQNDWGCCASSSPSRPCCCARQPDQAADTQLGDVQAAARATRAANPYLHASSERELDTAFATLREHKPARLLSAPTRSSTAGAIKSSRWRHATPFRRSTKGAIMPRPAA